MSEIDGIARLLKSSAELRLIVDLICSEPKKPDDALLRTIDWESFLTLSQRHGVTSLVYAQICQLGLTVVPPETTEIFATLYRERSARFLAQAFETGRVATALNANGTECLILKGVAVANLLYSSNPASRQSNDIDLLVSPEKVFAADKVLRREGYERILPGFDIPKDAWDVARHLLHAFEYVHLRDGHKLELHHRITANPYAMPSNFELLWTSAVTTKTIGGPVKCLGQTATLTYLCCHGATHAFSMLKWVCDIERAFNQIGLEEAQAIRHAGWSRYVTNAINLSGQIVDEVFGTKICGQLGIQRKRFAETFVVSQMMLENPPAGQRTFASILGELRLAFFLQRLGGSVAFTANEFVRVTCDVRDTHVVRSGRRWMFVYVMLGPVFSLIRFLRRRGRQPNASI